LQPATDPQFPTKQNGLFPPLPRRHNNLEENVL